MNLLTPRAIAEQLSVSVSMVHKLIRVAEIAGVSPRTIRRWVGGQALVPHDAWMKIQAHIDQHAPAAELPRLPPYEKADWQHGIITRYYTAEQMTEYARAAVELNRRK